MIPAGTKLPLGLLRPLRVKPGQDVYLQITFPVTVGSQMLIPPGAYVQGIVQQIVKKDRRSLQFAIVFCQPDFFEWIYDPFFRNGDGRNNECRVRACRSPAPAMARSIPAMAAVGSVAPPPLPPLPSFNGVRNVMIGLGVAAAVGTVVLIALARNGDPEIEAGTPMEIILPAPVYLDADASCGSNPAIRPADQQCSHCRS